MHCTVLWLSEWGPFLVDSSATCGGRLYGEDSTARTWRRFNVACMHADAVALRNVRSQYPVLYSNFASLSTSWCLLQTTRILRLKAFSDAAISTFLVFFSFSSSSITPLTSSSATRLRSVIESRCVRLKYQIERRGSFGPEKIRLLIFFIGVFIYSMTI